MWSELFDVVKSFGSFVGLVTGGFVIYDRLIRLRPVMYLGVSNYKLDLRFRNISNETIIVDEVSIRPFDYLSVSKANDRITTNEERQQVFYPSTAAKDDPRFAGHFILLKPQEERAFSLQRFAKFEGANASERIVIQCRWENTRRRWFARQHLRIVTTVGQLKKLIDTAAAAKV